MAKKDRMGKNKKDVINANRPNGKAFKKRPKTNKVKNSKSQ